MARDYYLQDIKLIEEMQEIEKMCLCQRRVKLYKPRQNPLETLSETEFRIKHRFSKATAVYIIDLIKEDLAHDSRGGGIPPHLQILIALRTWAGAENQDDIGDLSGISQPQVSIICRRVAMALIMKKTEFIKMPRTCDEQDKVITDFYNVTGFPQVIGVIDCTHIKVQKMKGLDGQYYVNRKGFSSLNVQVVCNAELEIMDIVEYWGGSTQDYRIFYESDIRKRFENGEFKGRLLGDHGYECTPYLFTPVLYPCTPKEGAYNFAHVRTRNLIDRCFSVWKQRFRCLHKGFTTNIENTKLFVVAMAILHNIGIKKDLFNEHTEEIENIAIPGLTYDSRGNVSRAAFIDEYF